MKKSIVGFTLIEILITLTILSILAAVALPDFSDMVRRNQVQTHLKSFTELMKYARSEAISSHRIITICPLSASDKCDGSGSWSDELTVFFNDNNNDTLEVPANDTIRVLAGVGSNTLTVQDAGYTNQDMITFDKRASVGATMTVRVCESRKDLRMARAVIIEASGMAVHSRVNSVTGVYTDVNGADLTCP